MNRTDIQSLIREACPSLEARIMELEEELAGLEKQVLSILVELQLHMVVHSYKKGKEMGQKAKSPRKKQ